MADLLKAADGAIRKADAALRTGGGRSVYLRLAGPAASGDDSEQLGLATPGFQDVELAPVAFHRAGTSTKLLVSGSAVATLLGSLAYDSADVLFETAVGVVVDGVVFDIETSVASQAMGAAYCYTLTLVPPVR